MKKTALILSIMVSFVHTGMSWQGQALRIRHLNTEKAPLSYFTGRQAEGKKALSTTYEDIAYWFGIEKDRDTLEANPPKIWRLVCLG